MRDVPDLRPPGGATTRRQHGELILDLTFAEPDLAGLRSAVGAHAGSSGLTGKQVEMLVFIAYELATNAVRHGGGQGRLCLWQRGDAVLCQVTDTGPGLPEGMSQPVKPDVAAADGRGLWLVATFADALDLRRGSEGGADVVATVHLPAAG